MTPDDLERLVADRLGRLPAPEAPASLHRRVMTAVSATRPAVRPWSIWPGVWRAIFALGLTTIAATGAVVWATVAANARGDAEWQIAVRAIVGATDAPAAARDAASVGWSWFAAVLTTPAALAVMALIAGAAVAFVLLGAWLSRIALPPIAWSRGASR